MAGSWSHSLNCGRTPGAQQNWTVLQASELVPTSYQLVNPTRTGAAEAKKKLKLEAGPTVKVEAKGIAVKKDASYANRVNDLAPLLSLTTPVYRFTPTSAPPTHMCSGAAYFTGDIPRHSKGPSQWTFSNSASTPLSISLYFYTSSYRCSVFQHTFQAIVAYRE
ncbi:MAG: hypothetical protein Q9192_005978 [Flavoplaca navasiana]